MDRPTYIYALADPRTGAIRYVGKSLYPVKRWRVHLHDKTNSRRGKWIRLIAKEGLRPLLYVLEGPCVDWEEAERRWIANLRAEGVDLTNLTDGGEGLKGATEETRAKMAAGRRAAFVRDGGYTGTYRENHLAAMADPEVKAKCSAPHLGEKNYWYGTKGPMGGRNHSSDTRAKMSTSHKAEYAAKGGHSAKTRAKQRIAALARPVIVCDRCGREIRNGKSGLARHQNSSKCVPT